MGSIVSLVKVKDLGNLESTISEALTLIGFKLDRPIKTVVIKPNLCYYWDSSTGYTTDPRIVGAIIDLIRKENASAHIKVAEADASAMRTRYAFPVLGYGQLAKEKKVELVNLSSDVLEDRTEIVQGHKIRLKVPQSLLKSDLFINVPKLKIMRATKITCAMKNIFGCIATPRKTGYHPVLKEAIVGINKILHPHLTIVDGMVALGSHPIRLNLIMASTDPFSADWIASKIAGYDPAKVEFLKMAIKEKLGTSAGIMTRGENLAEFKRAFPKPGFKSSKRWWSLQFLLLKMYCKASGDIIPPVLEEA